MKNMKKFFALVLTVVMMMAMSVVAFAAEGDGNIIINGPVEGAKYQAYKMFDATYSGTSGTAVSYTLINNDITLVTGFDDVFATKENGGKTYVTKKNGVTDEALISWIKTNKDAIKAASVAKGSEVIGSGSSITLETGEFGYYMVWSDAGNTVAVSVDTTHPQATVNSKLPSTPSINPSDGKKVDGKLVNTMEVGEEVRFTVTFTATNYEVKDGVSTPISQYIVTDTPDGFDINASSVTVTVNGADYAIAGKQITSVKDADGNLTVTIPWDQTTYNTSNVVVVTYTAKLTNKNIAAASSNKAQITYNNTTLPDVPEVYTYNYKIIIDKVDDADDTVKLEGAKFILKKATDGKFYSVDTNTGVVSWVGSQESATVAVTDSNGAATFAGLKAGDYILVETQAPEGYNLAENKTISLVDVTGKLNDNTTLTVTSEVRDKSGSILPSTGGIGTTIFYVIGAILVLGAGVILITRRRMSAK